MSTDRSAFAFDADEVVQWSAHPRLMIVLPDAVLGVVLVVIGVGSVVIPDVFSTVAPGWSVPWLVLLIPVGIVLPVWTAIVVTNTRFVITDRALYEKRGVFGRRVEQIGIDRVQNSSYSQGIRGAFLGYGTVSVDTAGGYATVRFHDIENPQTVSTLINRTVTDENTGPPGTIGQYREILAELRTLRSALETSR